MARISTTPRSSLPPTGICQSDPRDFGKATIRAIRASTDDRGAITVLHVWQITFSHQLRTGAFATALERFLQTVNVLLQVFDALLQLLLAGVLDLIHLLAAAVHQLGVSLSQTSVKASDL